VDISLSPKEVSKAIEIYIALKGYEIKGAISVQTSYGDIKQIVTKDVKPFPYELNMEILKTFVNK
jgi:hypothetical protein